MNVRYVAIHIMRSRPLPKVELLTHDAEQSVADVALFCVVTFPCERNNLLCCFGKSENSAVSENLCAATVATVFVMQHFWLHALSCLTSTKDFFGL